MTSQFYAMLANVTMKAAKPFARLRILLLFSTMPIGAGCAALGPAAIHAAPKALLGRNPAAAVGFVPLHILIPTVQTTISTTSHLLMKGVAESGKKVKKTTERTHYEKENP